LAQILCALCPDKKLSVKFGNIVDLNYTSLANVSLCTDKLKKLDWQQKIQIEEGLSV
jgi:hypothetical protein